MGNYFLLHMKKHLTLPKNHCKSNIKKVLNFKKEHFSMREKMNKICF